MDVNFFLNQRTAFIRQFYDAASFPFSERIQKIEAEEEPFEPPYSEDGEPPFMAEWVEAYESLQILGYTCVSMLASALHLYLKTWETEIGRPTGDSFKAEFKKGWLSGYKAYFAAYFEIKFDDGPANISLLEEVVLARNTVQHPTNIASQISDHPLKYDGETSRAFFVRDWERKLFGDIDESENRWLFPLSLHITKDKVMAAITEVEKFSGWLESQIVSHIYQR